MEKKINIAELLKDCPQGMELDCTMYEDVVFERVESGNYPIIIRIKDDEDSIAGFTEFGEWNYTNNAKCVIFPKGKTTWEGFVPPCKFKDGDIIYVKSVYEWIAIYKESDGNGVYKYIGISVLRDKFVKECNPLCYKRDIKEIRYATEEEKQKLLDAIKDNGYKWNAETKTLEKLIEPKFKVGDRIKHKNGKDKNGVEQGLILSITDDTYDVAVTNDMGIFVPIADQDEWELVPNKFNISTLKPFDKCKYSLDKGRTWKFAHYWYIQDKHNVNDIEIELWQD